MARGSLPFPRRFLIPTDGGPAATAAARVGLRLARALGASVRVVAVVDPQVMYDPAALGPLRPRLQAELRSKAAAAVAAVASQARRLGVACRTAVRQGPVVPTILVEARRYRPGLVILGTRGHTGLARLVLGSVAAHAAAKAPCPVLLVPPAAGPRRRRRAR